MQKTYKKWQKTIRFLYYFESEQKLNKKHAEFYYRSKHNKLHFLPGSFGLTWTFRFFCYFAKL